MYRFFFVVAFFGTIALSQTPDSILTRSPEWARKAVWYQIFPERFRNGNPLNDPKVTDLNGSWPHETPGEWHISPWTSDWYKLQPWEEADGKGFYYHSQLRRYGGDLQGVMEELDYLKDLGVNALYFTPLFQSPSLHKYDASMYHHIDKNFGPDPDGDAKIIASENPADPSTWHWTSADSLFLRLLKEAHQRGMHVIIDGVFNHVGMTFWAFEDVKKRQQASPYKDWFTIYKWDDTTTQTNEFEYKGWYGVKELPELRKDSNNIVAGPHDHIRSIVHRWMDPNGDGNPSDGIDGWRLDVADMVPLGFWREFRQWVRGINPNAYITGEVWWQDWQHDKMFDADPWLQGDAFDAVMNYRWAREVCGYFIDKKNKISVQQFDTRLDALRRNYLAERTVVLMNLMDSHDTDRLLSHIVNPDRIFDHNVGPGDDRAYDVRKPNKEEIAIQKLIVAFQMTYTGAPMVYYGDEVGMWGGDDPDCRKPMLWADMKYEDEASHPFQQKRPVDQNKVDDDLLSFYKRLIGIHHAHRSITDGDFSTLVTDSVHDVYSYMRTATDDTVLVAINNANSAQKVIIPQKFHLQQSAWSNLLNPSETRNAGMPLEFILPQKSLLILSSHP